MRNISTAIKITGAIKLAFPIADSGRVVQVRMTQLDLRELAVPFQVVLLPPATPPRVQISA